MLLPWGALQTHKHRTVNKTKMQIASVTSFVAFGFFACFKLAHMRVMSAFVCSDGADGRSTDALGGPNVEQSLHLRTFMLWLQLMCSMCCRFACLSLLVLVLCSGAPGLAKCHAAEACSRSSFCDGNRHIHNGRQVDGG
jgi:hypothetical protein